MNILEAFNHLSATVQGALITGAFGIPAVWFAHRLGLRKQADDSDDKFSGRMLEALAQRDKTIEAQGQQIVGFIQTQMAVVKSLGEAQAQLSALERAQTASADRERQYVAELAKLKVQLSHYESCGGGSPCPFKRTSGPGLPPT